MARSAGFMGKVHADKTREKIKVTQIVNRLQKHVLADEEIMTATQINAARILLNKAIPDLTYNANENTGDLVIKVLNLAADGD